MARHPQSRLHGTQPRTFTHNCACSQIHESLGLQGIFDTLQNLLDFGWCVHVAIPILFGMQKFAANNLDFKVTCGIRCALSSHLHISPESIFNLLTDPVILRGVTSSTTINNMYL